MAYLELVNKEVELGESTRILDTLYLDETDGLLKLKLDEGEFEFNLENPSKDLQEWLKLHLWPNYKNYSFAYQLKKIATKIFGLSEGQVYGTDKQKNSPTKFHWSSVSLEAAKGFGFSRKTEIPDRQITAREFLQIFGTEYVRVFKDDAWVTQTLNAIEKDKVNIAVITDARFENEIKEVKKAGGKVIYLTRQISDDKHSSENGISPDSKYVDYILDNSGKTSLSEKNAQLFNILQEWDMVPEEFKDIDLDSVKA